MKRSLTKTFSVILAIVLTIMSLNSEAFAASHSCSESAVVDTSADIITTDAFRDVFYPEKKDSEEVKIDKITYSYEIAPRKDASLADVILIFSITLGSQEYQFATYGIVDAYQLSSGETLWEGPLSGHIEINKTTYKVLAGFSKIDNNPEIQVSVSIQAENKIDAIQPIVFIFGEEVITTQIHQEITNKSHVESITAFSKPFEEFPKGNRSGSFSYVGCDFEYFDSGFNISGYAQRSRGYFDSNTNRFAVTIKSYCDNVENYFSSSGIAEAAIKSFDIKLIRDDNYTMNSFSYIVGIESYDFNVGNFGAGAVLIKPLFEDIMSILGVPTSTISAIFNGLKGSAEKDVYTSNTTVSISFGLLYNADFDNSGAGVPIVFQLTRNQNNYTGNSSYTFKTSITYRVVYTPIGSTYPSYIYIDGYDTSKTVSVTLG
ncbi:MAG: hypothetical protein K5629_01620 [Eubacteriales bacterium]|nr:hypothetical protein [Eubacteriales bacterium]